MVSTLPEHAIYRGWVRHQRHAPRPHAFAYRVFMAYLALDRLEQAFAGRWLWSVGRPNVCWFRRADYAGDPTRPLDQEVRRMLAERLGRRVTGPIFVLTNLRTLGYVQNPVTFYYAFEPAGGALDAVLAEVTNTPWGERHAYAVDVRATRQQGRPAHVRFPKAMHVSPFFPMEHEYRWAFRTPGRVLAVHMENWAQGAKVFEATLRLERRPLDGRQLALALLNHPFITGKVALAIYWQALRLWWKGIPFHPHPRTRGGGPPAAPDAASPTAAPASPADPSGPPAPPPGEAGPASPPAAGSGP